RCAVVMKARLLAKTMSRGSSPTSSVLVTRGGEAATSTMLTLSERWVTTHTSPSVRSATAHRSEPDGAGREMRGRARAHGEDLELVVRRVERVEPARVRRQRQRTNLPGLEGRE